LTPHVEYLLKNPKELHTGKFEKPQTRGKFYSDRRKDALEAIEYLTLLGNHLPEKQSEKVFTREMLLPLVKAILSKYEQKKEPVKNTRIFKIALMLINEGEETAWELLPNREVSMLMTSEGIIEKSRIIRTLSHFYDSNKQETKKEKGVKP
jgi:hypothetical protein